MGPPHMSGDPVALLRMHRGFMQALQPLRSLHNRHDGLITP